MGRRKDTVTPDSWLPRGEASCSRLRPPMAVWQGIPGELCQVHIYAPGNNRNLARWEKAVGRPDAHRVDPPCDRYSVCGGCPFMHMDREGQRRARLSVAHNAYDLSGLAEYAPTELRDGPEGLEGYRHLVKLAVGRSDRGRPRVGAFGRSTRNVVPIPNCRVITPALREAMRLVAHLVIELDVWPWDPERERGVLRYVVMRQSRASGKLLITLVAARTSPKLGDLAQELVQKLGALAGVHLHLNRSPGNALFDPGPDGGIPTVRLEGARSIEECVAGLRLPIGAGDFFQTNPGVAELIIRDLEEWIPPDRAVVDLYSGVGGLCLASARRAGWALGVEVVETAVKRAKGAASLNAVPAEFLAAEVVEALPEIERRLAGRQGVGHGTKRRAGGGGQPCQAWARGWCHRWHRGPGPPAAGLHQLQSCQPGARSGGVHRARLPRGAHPGLRHVPQHPPPRGDGGPGGTRGEPRLHDPGTSSSDGAEEVGEALGPW